MAKSDEIYVSPSQISKYRLKIGDTLEGLIRSPKDGERHFAISKLNFVNGDKRDFAKYHINFDDFTPVYPN
jgi:transcription termination factor Rho